MNTKRRIGEISKRESLRIKKLQGELEQLRARLSQTCSLTVPITTFAPEPYDLIRDIPVVVQPLDDEYLASFFDANVNASGCNETAAVANLKDVMLSIFEYLSEQPKSKLGPGPTRQLAVLKEFIRKRPCHGKDHNEATGNKNRKEVKSRDRQDKGTAA